MFDDQTVSHDAYDDMGPESNLHDYYVVTLGESRMFVYWKGDQEYGLAQYFVSQLHKDSSKKWMTFDVCSMVFMMIRIDILSTILYFLYQHLDYIHHMFYSLKNPPTTIRL